MKVEIYGTNWCTFCKMAVDLCESKGIDYNYVDVDDSSNLKVLSERIGTNVRSVPQIFVNGEHVSNGFNGLKEKIV